ncbi:MAG: TIGR03118 family protein [Ideonella sp.]|nr:TIGR03118 family protein [Ideonella sp.]
MKRRTLLQQTGLAAVAPAFTLSACGGGDNEAPNRYSYKTLVASPDAQASFPPSLSTVVSGDDFINAWGIAIRPAGAGGHFWVTAGRYSYQFVGDVSASPDPKLRTLFQDGLRLMDVPGTEDGGFATGTAFNGAAIDSNTFWVNNQPVLVNNETRFLSGSARFLFATDTGVISGWTERDPGQAGVPVRTDGPAVAMVDDSANGAAFFGLALNPQTWQTLWVADFGTKPRLRQFNAQWKEETLLGFANPFATGTGGVAQPGDFVPFNVQALKVAGFDVVMVAYAKSQPDPNDPTKFYAAEEVALAANEEGETPNLGKVVMFSLAGQRLLTLDDQRLNAPWGVAVAPDNFGALSGCILVGNFGGAGRIAGYDAKTGRFRDWLRAADGKPWALAGLWGMQFGNGVSLGDSNALYVAAGPEDETQGVFGVIRPHN